MLNLSQPQRGIVMGILNVTPDSFSDGGDFLRAESAVLHAMAMVQEGADIIDIGGESTRPPGSAYGVGARAISLEEELERVIPVIEGIRAKDATIRISIDTQKAALAEAAISAGANIINDVSAGTSDEGMFGMAAKCRVPIILMHGHGPHFDKPKIEEYRYDDVVKQVYDYLSERAYTANTAGVQEIWVDVGIGFAKTYNDNMKLLRSQHVFASLGLPVVLGVSRKSSIGVAMGGGIAPKDRMIGSVAAASYGYEHGAAIIRTHDVKATREALNVIQAIIQA